MIPRKSCLRFLSVPLLSLLLLLAGCAGKTLDNTIEAGAKRLSASEIRETVSGNTLQVTEYDGSAEIEIYPSGKLFGKNSDGDTNTGRWKVDAADRLCMKFSKWAFGEKKCYAVYQLGDEFRQFTANGVLASTFTITPGTSRNDPAAAKSPQARKDIVVEKAPPPAQDQPEPTATPIARPRRLVPSPDGPRARTDLRYFYREMAKDCPGCDLRELNLAGAGLMRANLAGANLEGVDFGGANLKMANLKGASLKEANLAGADLSGADLRGADLTGANLKGTNFRRAVLKGAILEETTGADLTGAIR